MTTATPPKPFTLAELRKLVSTDNDPELVALGTRRGAVNDEIAAIEARRHATPEQSLRSGSSSMR
jgi:chorismate mutase